MRNLQTDEYILLWLCHPQFTWYHKKMGITPEEQPAGELLLENVPDGTWLVEWLDTTDGEFVQRGVVTANNDHLNLRTPQTATSVAARIHRIAD